MAVSVGVYGYEIWMVKVVKKDNSVKFQVVTAVSMMMTVFWDVAPCCFAEVYRRFRGPCCLHHQGDESGVIALMMVAASTSETSVNFYQTTRRNIPQDSNLQNNSGL
jgi:hypothetical protein